MKLTSIEDVEAFKAVLAQCEGDVWLESIYGDKYNLKSALSQYIALAALLKDNEGALELFAGNRDDEYRLLAFIEKLGK